MTIETVQATATPECDKMLAVRDESQSIGEFLEWAEEKGYVLCSLLPRRDYIGDVIKGQQEYCPQVPAAEELLAEFFSIDLEVVEREKRAVLATLREAPDADCPPPTAAHLAVREATLSRLSRTGLG